MLLPALASLLLAAPTGPVGWDPGDDGLVVRFVDDLGAPLANAPVHLSRRTQGRRRGGGSWTRQTGLRDAPSALDGRGELRLEARDGFLGALVVQLAEDEGLGHATPSRYEFEWDGAPGEQVVEVPRTGTVEGQIVAPGPHHGIEAALSNDTRTASSGLQPVYPHNSLPLAVDADGSFRLPGLSPGRFELTFTRGRARTTVDVDVPAGGTSRVRDLRLHTGGGWIVGRVAAPAEGDRPRTLVLVTPAREYFFDPSSAPWLEVAAGGTFRAGTLERGLYRVTAHRTTPREGDGPYGVEAPYASEYVWCDGGGETRVDLPAPGANSGKGAAEPRAGRPPIGRTERVFPSSWGGGREPVVRGRVSIAVDVRHRGRHVFVPVTLRDRAGRDFLWWNPVPDRPPGEAEPILFRELPEGRYEVCLHGRVVATAVVTHGRTRTLVVQL
ncbi:MAG: carboxypeptidase-like regulatory domain-containing protein [Planctomycetota bacterium]